jgi:hypothetical protein
MAILKERSRTASKYVYYALQLYFFSGLSLKNITKAISIYQKKPCFDLELDPALQNQGRYIANKRDANYQNLS